MSDKFDSGEEFASWLYASTTEVGQLFTSTGGAGTYTGALGPDQEWISDLLVLWGITNVSPAVNQTWELTGSDSPIAGQNYGSRLYDAAPSGGVDFAWTEGFIAPDDLVFRFDRGGAIA